MGDFFVNIVLTEFGFFINMLSFKATMLWQLHLIHYSFTIHHNPFSNHWNSPSNFLIGRHLPTPQGITPILRRPVPKSLSLPWQYCRVRSMLLVSVSKRKVSYTQKQKRLWGLILVIPCYHLWIWIATPNIPLPAGLPADWLNNKNKWDFVKLKLVELVIKTVAGGGTVKLILMGC